MSDLLSHLGLDAEQSPLIHDAQVVRAEVVIATVDMATFEVVHVDGTRTEAICPKTEFYVDRQWQVGEIYTMLLLAGANRPMVSVQRRELVTALFAGVSPEVRRGDVRVMEVARLPGVRAKVAVASTVEGLDPVAACVGRRANRVREVVDTLMGERIDIVAWHPDRQQYLLNALAPAEASRVEINGRAATVYAPEHQVASAIGGGGLNSSLAGRLVGLQVEIVSK